MSSAASFTSTDSSHELVGRGSRHPQGPGSRLEAEASVVPGGHHQQPTV